MLRAVFVLCTALGLGACGGTSAAPMTGMDAGNSVGIAGDGTGTMTAAVGDACTQNSDCVSDLCTKYSYDRKPGPICTYECDPANPNPKCPGGCNMKGYCRVP